VGLENMRVHPTELDTRITLRVEEKKDLLHYKWTGKDKAFKQHALVLI